MDEVTKKRLEREAAAARARFADVQEIIEEATRAELEARTLYTAAIEALAERLHTNAMARPSPDGISGRQVAEFAGAEADAYFEAMAKGLVEWQIEESIDRYLGAEDPDVPELAAVPPPGKPCGTPRFPRADFQGTVAEACAEPCASCGAPIGEHAPGPDIVRQLEDLSNPSPDDDTPGAA